MSRLVINWLDQRASTHADHESLCFEGRSMTFAELAARSAAWDRRLTALGVGPGTRVATLLPSTPEMVALAHAIPRGGRLLVPLGIRSSTAEVERLLRRSKSALVLHDGSAASLVDELRSSQSPRAINVREENVEGDPAEPRPASIDLDALHSIVFTSGTSGAAKGVLLSWGNHFWSATAAAFNLGVSRDDRWLVCMPLNHVGGLSVLTRSVLYGSTIELHRRFDADAVNRAIDGNRVTIVSVVANMMQRLLDARGDRPYPATLRAVLIGGGPVPRALIERCRSLAVPIVPTYGLTETASQIVTASPNHPPPAGSSGQALLSAEVRIVGDDARIAAAGEAGEIELRGPMVSPGYLDEPRRAADDWLRTRDRGYLDERGYLFVLGRGDDTVITGGENVHPGEIERALESHPLVAEAFAVGADDEQWGQCLIAAVRTTGEVSESELLRHCRQELAGFKVPRSIELLADFPRTPAGKIARKETARAVGANYKSRDRASVEP